MFKIKVALTPFSMIWRGVFLLCLAIVSSVSVDAQSGKEYFVNVQETIPTIVLDIRYFSEDNFMGTIVDGYKKPMAFVTTETGVALLKVQSELSKEGLGLKIFDAYRPQKGVNHFVRWAKVPSDTLTKSKYYPQTNKADVFELGYVASKSGHSRGSTLDLTLIYLESGMEVDMGSGWDFFGEISWHAAKNISKQQKANRNKLKDVMLKFGFKLYTKEWWHYTLVDEPFPKTYFDFDVD
jgi:D-alanyl-D-alanine dipeptidase